MYSREILPPPEHLVQNGKPIFGTFSGFPKKLDIRGVEAPFGVPLPHFITNFRIKSSLTFMFNLGPYIGVIDFFDQKAFGYAEVVFWEKESGRKLTYRTLMGPRRRFIPHNMEAGYCSSLGKSRYIRISWDHARDRISVIFNLAGDSARPSVQGAFVGHYTSPTLCEITTNMPSPTRLRCSASYIAATAIQGTLSLDKTKLSQAVPMEKTNGQALLTINRNYYNFLSEAEFVSAAGVVKDKYVSFTISAAGEDATETASANQNVLFVDGKCTPLPPVVITHPFGFTSKWVIQDTENMVDLTFTPISDNFRDMAFFIIHTKLHTIFGKFEGNLKTADGEDIPIHSFEGIAKNQLIRL